MNPILSFDSVSLDRKIDDGGAFVFFPDDGDAVAFVMATELTELSRSRERAELNVDHWADCTRREGKEGVFLPVYLRTKSIQETIADW